VIKQLSLYKPVRDNRQIPHISSQVISPKILSVANLSCYECDECLFDDISLLLQKPTCRVLWSLGMRSFVEIS
jgi:hypothetical protein